MIGGIRSCCRDFDLTASVSGEVRGWQASAESCLEYKHMIPHRCRIVELCRRTRGHYSASSFRKPRIRARGNLLVFVTSRVMSPRGRSRSRGGYNRAPPGSPGLHQHSWIAIIWQCPVAQARSNPSIRRAARSLNARNCSRFK